MPKRPEDLIRDELRALTSYHVPESSGMVKLDAMENPYGLPQDMRAEIGALAAQAEFNRYPDSSGWALKERLRAAMEIPPGMEILLGNGSDELIQIVAFALARPGAKFLGAEPSFAMYRMIAAGAGASYVEVPLKDDFSLDEERMLDALARHQPAVVFLAYPNNPSGNLFDGAAIARIIEAAPGLVVIDEAYFAFAGASFLPVLPGHPNLLVMRTLSKSGLAGLRLGFMAGRKEWLGEFEKLRLPYNVNVLTQKIVEWVLGRPEVLHAQAGAIVAEREKLFARLNAIAGVRAYPSRANFILFRVADAQQVFDGLSARGVLIKNLNRAHALLADCLRVTVGTPQENESFLRALKDSLA